MIAKVTSINIEQDRFWMVGGAGTGDACYLVLSLSRCPNVRIGDEFIVTVQRATDVEGRPEEKGGDEEC